MQILLEIKNSFNSKIATLDPSRQKNTPYSKAAPFKKIHERNFANMTLLSIIKRV